MTGELQGIPVVPGVGWGPVIRPAPRPQPPVGLHHVTDAQEERSRFCTAAKTVIDRLLDRAGQTDGVGSEVLAATAAIAGDPELTKGIEQAIESGQSAVEAVWTETMAVMRKFQQAGGMLAERTADVADIRDRFVAELLGLPEPGVPQPDEVSVLVADDLAPADTALLDADVIAAIAIRLGGPTSHTAIIARQLGIPCVVAVSELSDVQQGQVVLVDGSAGTITLDPDPDYAASRLAQADQAAQEAARWRGHGATKDGVSVELLANVQDGEGAEEAAAGVAVGVGLFRTELAFLNAPAEPSVDQQAQMYQQVIDAFEGHRIIIRTLDAGSDKPMPFLPYEGEDNPALGVRGVRVACRTPHILDRQLQAIALAAQHASPPWVMAPMVATRAEARCFADKVRDYGLVPGVMIEVPAAALRCQDILQEVDFVSIGTNDLSQYTMAADRLSPDLARLCDPWQPAVLELVGHIASVGLAAEKHVGVCGEAAADPLLAIVLVGLGVSSLSAAPQALPAVGSVLSKVDAAICRQAAHEALQAEDGAHARKAAHQVVYG